MTIIKYATIGHARTSDKVLVLRGKKTGQVGFRSSDDEDKPFSDPIYSEEIVELPDRMTPTEYREYIEETVGETRDDPVTDALISVAEDKGVDVEEWGLPALEAGEGGGQA